ncbi:MAG TPA: Crp/Fnr family transcriptional regulator [Sandaracinaceae bacterium LLY-WYZ-13_1]|nr:Crp/Fnr family transcriptional regulator [Sandaracinaceae bacterium LLY-WYZ-13_1]
MSVDLSVLDTVPVLASLGTDDKQALAGIVVRDHLDAGTVLFEEGQPAEEVFFLLEGAVELSVELKGRGDQTVLRLGPGEVVGWAGMMPYERIATARVTEKASVLRMEGWALGELCEKDHDVGFAVMKILATELGKRLRDVLLGMKDAAG